MQFKYLFPNKIIFESGASKDIGNIVKSITSNPLIVTGSSSLKTSKNYFKILESLEKEKIKYVNFSGINGEPTPEVIDDVTEFALNKNIDCVISIGGGSVIDTGKAVAALLVNKKGVENYLEGVGKGYIIEKDPLPFIAVPTTAGSGAEATKNSVITSRGKKYKKSFRDEKLLAKIIIIDPELTLTLPKAQTAYGGMDAICQLIESYVSKKRNPFCSMFSEYYIPRALRAIIKAYNQPENVDARSIMSASGFASGIALANSGLGAAHGFASGIGGMFDIPHGLICAVLLPGVCKKNAEKSPETYSELASIVNDDNSKDINKFINKLYSINEQLNIPKDFKNYNIGSGFSKEIIKRSYGSSMSGNPIDFSEQEWEDFIIRYL